jgi:hypothetical protein
MVGKLPPAACRREKARTERRKSFMGSGIIRWTVVDANHALARSFAAAHEGWMSENVLLAGEGKSIFS